MKNNAFVTEKLKELYAINESRLKLNISQESALGLSMQPSDKIISNQIEILKLLSSFPLNERERIKVERILPEINGLLVDFDCDCEDSDECYCMEDLAKPKLKSQLKELPKFLPKKHSSLLDEMTPLSRKNIKNSL